MHNVRNHMGEFISSTNCLFCIYYYLWCNLEIWCYCYFGNMVLLLFWKYGVIVIFQVLCTCFLLEHNIPFSACRSLWKPLEIYVSRIKRGHVVCFRRNKDNHFSSGTCITLHETYDWCNENCTLLHCHWLRKW